MAGQEARTVFIGPEVTWARVVREVARAERAGVPLWVVGPAAKGRRFTLRLHEIYPHVLRFQDAGTREWRALVGWSGQDAVAGRLSRATRA